MVVCVNLASHAVYEVCPGPEHGSCGVVAKQRASSVPGKRLHLEVAGGEEQIIRHGQREEN
jgi:hypothetical protein